MSVCGGHGVSILVYRHRFRRFGLIDPSEAVLRKHFLTGFNTTIRRFVRPGYT